MKNFPKLSSTFQESQFRSELYQNQPQGLGQCKSRKLTTASQGRNLSPFTWNNIKLPAVLIREKYEKEQKQREKQQKKQLLTKNIPNTNGLIQAIKLTTIQQKAKKAQNISTQLRKMLPQKVSQLKNLHQKVLIDSQQRKNKLTTNQKHRQNRSFTQKETTKLLSKAYQTMDIRANNNNTSSIKQYQQVDDLLMKTEQRYRNISSYYVHSNDNEKNGSKVIMNAAKEKKSRYYDVRQSSLLQEFGSNPIPSLRGKKIKSKDNNNNSPNQLNSQLIDQTTIAQSPKHPISKNIHSHSLNQQMQPYIRHYFTKLPHQKDPNKPKIFVTTNPKYHPFHIKQHNSSALNNNHQPQNSNLQHINTLIWTKLQSLNIFRQKTNEQYYNHVQGSHVLTSKEKINQLLNGGRGGQKFFYPVTFSLPKQYNQFVQEYDWVMVRMTLKFIVREIDQFQKGISEEIQQDTSISSQPRNFTVCLSDILEDLTRDTKNEPQLKLLKFCLFLQSARKKQKLNNYFEKLSTYRSVDINLSQTIYIDIIDWCIQLMRLNEEKQSSEENQNEQAKKIISNYLSLQNVDYRLIQLLKSYNYLFLHSLPSYLYRNLHPSYNTWLIKPFASSKAAGISLIINSSEFYTTQDYEYKQYRHRAKYHNKLFMKYIQNPLLIGRSGMDYFVQKYIKEMRKQAQQKNQDQQGLLQQKINQVNQKVYRLLTLEEKFCGRKFDIRQWIIIVCDELNDFSGEQQGNDKMTASIYLNGRKSPRNNKSIKRTKICKYHTAYCRFAQKQYSLSTNDPEVHLTNYQMYKKSSLKTDRKKSPSINHNNNSKDHKLRNASILQKSNNFDSLATEDNTKEKVNNSGDKPKTRKRLGSIIKEEKESVLMLDELFEYVDFSNELKGKKSANNSKDKNHRNNLSLMKQKYNTQLDSILKSVFDASYSHLVHHNRTFELFGVDLLMDEEMNLYLLEINLNPGCSSERQEKLGRQAEQMLESMFETVIGFEGQKQTQHEIQKNPIQKITNKMIGSRQYIGDSDLQIESQREVQIDYCSNQQQFSKNEFIDQRAKLKQKQKQNKWILVKEKNTF